MPKFEVIAVMVNPEFPLDMKRGRVHRRVFSVTAKSYNEAEGIS